MSLTIGSDPELFVHDGNRVKSAIGLLGGSKDEPLQVHDGAVQEDNVLAEFNINPAKNVDEFLFNIQSVRSQMDKMLSKHGLSTLVKSSHRYKPAELERFGPQAMRFGCDPDYDAWTGAVNPTPDANSTLRTAGGHVHVGFDFKDEDDKFKMAAMMDLFLGVPSVLMDSDKERRSMYGKAGSCRLKDYGVEYRSLSNFWLANDDLIKWVYNNTVMAANNLHRISDVAQDAEDIRRCIDESDEDMARMLVDKWEVPVCHCA